MPPKGCRNARRARRAPAPTISPQDIAEDNLPRCQCPGCPNSAMPIADDFFNNSSMAMVAIVRNGVTIAVGKFTGWALEQLMVPGDRLYFNDSREVIFQGPASESEESAETG